MDGLVQNPESGECITQRLTLGLYENAPEGKSVHLPSVSLHSPLYRLSTLSIQAREGEGVIYK